MLLGCARDPRPPAQISGDWRDSKAHGKRLRVEAGGERTLVTIGDKTFPAVFDAKARLFHVPDLGNATMSLDEATDRLLFAGDDYKRITARSFLGKWRLVSGENHPVTGKVVQAFLEIADSSGSLGVIYKTELDGFHLHAVSMTYSQGRFVGDYYGGRGNFVLEMAGDSILALSVNPFREFAPILGAVFQPALSTMVVSPGRFFPGVWEANGGSKHRIVIVRPYQDDFVMKIGDRLTDQEQVEHPTYDSFAVFEQNILMSSDIDRSIHITPVDSVTVSLTWKKEGLNSVTYRLQRRQ